MPHAPHHGRHRMRQHETAEEMRKHELDIRKRVAENTQKFSWPNTIIWKGQEIRVTSKFPTFALYVLGASQMNRKIILPKDVYLRWLKTQEGLGVD